MPKANDRQVGGSHYKGMAVEPWDFVDAVGLGFVRGNVVKYLCRSVVRRTKKERIQELEKAAHYLEKAIEREHEQ